MFCSRLLNTAVLMKVFQASKDVSSTTQESQVPIIIVATTFARPVQEPFRAITLLEATSWLARTTRTVSDRRKATAASSTTSSATTWEVGWLTPSQSAPQVA